MGKNGRLKKILEALARHLEDKGVIDLEYVRHNFC